MVDAPVRANITEEELLRMESQHGARYEVVDGELVEVVMPPRHLHMHVIANLFYVIGP